MELETPPRPAPKRHYQYSLWRLLALVGVVATLLGSWRAWGTWAIVAIAGAALLALPSVWRPRWLYVWLLPLVWTAVAWANFYHPGDEYGGFGVGSIAGLWILAIVDWISDPKQMLAPILLAGAATVAVAGAAMDKLRVPWIVWIVLLSGAAMALFLWWFGSFPSAERALSKNGSYQAYVLPSINVGLCFATIATLLGAGIYRLRQWFRDRLAAARGGPR